ncbi:MAG TPA: diphthamide synthesis protein [Candidatus Nanoarchaeia archaeon]|nr:diphthamide synthesis protein [Candidatus Nanoarchaeia archaeon]
MTYEIELDKVVAMVKESNAKVVCVQLADGIKPRGKEIQDAIESQTEAKVILWGGSAFGGCDLPRGLEAHGIDLLIHFGHSYFSKPEYHKIHHVD